MSIQADGLDEVREIFREIQARANNLCPYFQGIGEILVTSIQENYENKKSSSGTPWTPLKAKTLARKRRIGIDPQMLRGENATIERTLDFKIKSDCSGVTAGVHQGGYPYLAVHQFGSRSRNIPARPFLPVGSDGKLDSRVKAEIMEFLENELTNLN